jgi:hypothetical protein
MICFKKSMKKVKPSGTTFFLDEILADHKSHWIRDDFSPLIF